MNVKNDAGNCQMLTLLNSRIAEWLSRDPEGEGSDDTLYSYVWNRPTDWVDPLGLAGGGRGSGGGGAGDMSTVVSDAQDVIYAGNAATWAKNAGVANVCKDETKAGGTLPPPEIAMSFLAGAVGGAVGYVMTH